MRDERQRDSRVGTGMEFLFSSTQKKGSSSLSPLSLPGGVALAVTPD